MGPEGHGQGGERERRRNTDERIAPSFTVRLPRVYPVALPEAVCVCVLTELFELRVGHKAATKRERSEPRARG